MMEYVKQYTNALYDLALEEHIIESIKTDIEDINGLFKENPQYALLLSNPAMDIYKRNQMIDDTFKNNVHEYVLNFMKLLMEKQSIRLYAPCAEEFLKRYDKDHNLERVTAITARALSDELKNKLVEKIEQMTKATIILTNIIDPDCLGGVILKFDDRQIDGSVRSRLESIKHQIFSTIV